MFDNVRPNLVLTFNMKEPKKLTKPDWTDVHDLICDHVQSIVDGDIDVETAHEDQHQIFMAVLEAVFGDGAQIWYEQALGNVDAEDDDADSDEDEDSEYDGDEEDD